MRRIKLSKHVVNAWFLALCRRVDSLSSPGTDWGNFVQNSSLHLPSAGCAPSSGAQLLLPEQVQPSTDLHCAKHGHFHFVNFSVVCHYPSLALLNPFISEYSSLIFFYWAADCFAYIYRPLEIIFVKQGLSRKRFPKQALEIDTSSVCIKAFTMGKRDKVREFTRNLLLFERDTIYSGRPTDARPGVYPSGFPWNDDIASL